AATAQVGLLDQGDDLLRLHAQRLAQAGVAVELLVVVDQPRGRGVEPLGQDWGQGHLSPPLSAAPDGCRSPNRFLTWTRARRARWSAWWPRRCPRRPVRRVRTSCPLP